jgi:hypothetical protein
MGVKLCRVALIGLLLLVGGFAGATPVARAADFCDVGPGSPYYEAVMALAERGIVRGYADGCFGPEDTTLRAQMAGFIARAAGWDDEDHGNPFIDRGPVDADLWRNVGALAHYDVARGYGDGTFAPTAEVLRAQTISFITRAMVAAGYWEPQPDDPRLYPNVPAASGHRADLVTYVRASGPLPGAAAVNADWTGWDGPATRGWFALAEYQALRSIPPGNPCDAAAPPASTADPGTVVLADNFERHDLANWTVVEQSGDASVSIGLDRAVSGRCAARLRVTATPNSRASLVAALPQGTGEVWASGRFNVQAEGSSAASNVPFLRLFAGTDRVVDLYRQNVSGALYLRTPDAQGGYVYTSLYYTVALDRWYSFTIHAIAAGDASTVEIWVDGAKLFGTSATNLFTTEFNTVRVGSEHFAQEGILLADDIVIKRVP